MRDAGEAARSGLVAGVAGDVFARATEIAGEIAAAAPVAVAQVKATLRDGAHQSLDEALDREASRD